MPAYLFPFQKVRKSSDKNSVNFGQKGLFCTQNILFLVTALPCIFSFASKSNEKKYNVAIASEVFFLPCQFSEPVQ